MQSSLRETQQKTAGQRRLTKIYFISLLILLALVALVLFSGGSGRRPRGVYSLTWEGIRLEMDLYSDTEFRYTTSRDGALIAQFSGSWELTGDRVVFRPASPPAPDGEEGFELEYDAAKDQLKTADGVLIHQP